MCMYGHGHTFILIHHGTHPLEVGGYCRPPTCQKSSCYQNICIHTLQRHLHHPAALQLWNTTQVHTWHCFSYVVSLNIQRALNNSGFIRQQFRIYDTSGARQERIIPRIRAGSTSSKLTRYRFIRTIWRLMFVFSRIHITLEYWIWFHPHFSAVTDIWLSRWSLVSCAKHSYFEDSSVPLA